MAKNDPWGVATNGSEISSGKTIFKIVILLIVLDIYTSLISLNTLKTLYFLISLGYRK